MYKNIIKTWKIMKFLHSDNTHRALLSFQLLLHLFLLATTSSAQSIDVEQCGSQAGGALCPQGFCCSNWGFCGTTDAYCGPQSCQSQCPAPLPPPIFPPVFGPPPPSPPPPTPSPPSPPLEQCGSQAGGALCPQGFCCSNWGFCGNTDDYCGPQSCQTQCPPSPPPPTPSPPPPSPPPPTSSPPPPSPPPPSPPPPSPPPPSPPPPSPPPPSPPPPSPPPPSPPPPSPPPPSPPPTCPICIPPFCCNFQTGSCEFCTFPCTPITCGPLYCCGSSGFCMDCMGLQSVVSVPPPTPLGPLPDEGKDISSLITREMFEQMLLHRNNNDCPASGFYTYDAFITAAKSFPAFATTGDINARKREIATFFAQTSHETIGGWPSAPDGAYSRGYCFVEEIGGGDYCVPNIQWPCVSGKQYFGRGPIHLSYNYKYGECGDAIGVDLLRNPDLVTSDPVIAFKTALWFWMTPQPPKPSCHAVIIGKWVPSLDDQTSGRIPEFGVTTNIINGGLECGIGPDARVESRVGFFKRYCNIFGISCGENLDCNNQTPFGWSVSVATTM